LTEHTTHEVFVLVSRPGIWGNEGGSFATSLFH